MVWRYLQWHLDMNSLRQLRSVKRQNVCVRFNYLAIFFDSYSFNIDHTLLIQFWGYFSFVHVLQFSGADHTFAVIQRRVIECFLECLLLLIVNSLEFAFLAHSTKFCPDHSSKSPRSNIHFLVFCLFAMSGENLFIISAPRLPRSPTGGCTGPRESTGCTPRIQEWYTRAYKHKVYTTQLTPREHLLEAVKTIWLIVIQKTTPEHVLTSRLI